MATILNIAELQKRPGRIETFLGKLAKADTFVTKTGRFIADQLYCYDDRGFEILYPRKKPDFDKAVKLLKKARTSDSKCFAIGDSRSKKAVVPIADLAKTSEFGGKPSGASLARENEAVDKLTESLEEAIELNHGPITMNIDGTKSKDIVSVHVTDNPAVKSDFELRNVDDKPVVWISHKAGSTVKHFQQWGGISLVREPKIHQHKETQSFLADLAKAYPKGLPPTTTIYRRIKDRNLKMMAVYGNDFTSGKLGEQNVSVTLQGDPFIKKVGTYFEINATHRHYNGSSLDKNGYEPVFMAVYRGDRSDGGVAHCRIGIWPISGREGIEMP